MRILFLFTSIALLAACGGPQYGYARQYEPLADEEELCEIADAASYEELRRDPEAYRGRLIGWFGVVDQVKGGKASGQSRASLQLRFHQKRHLCSDQFESSCRVTVSETTGGPFTAILSLRSEDKSGKDRVYQGSLLKVYGTATGEMDDEGGPVIKAQYYRHWPRGNYVTTAAKGVMRR